ncbi:MAG: ABC transporter substrate-binding protein [SAR202 cluster bacterium]|nr:ABC transporter substrate-binding protein [SAR202 cluster bacterium]
MRRRPPRLGLLLLALVLLLGVACTVEKEPIPPPATAVPAVPAPTAKTAPTSDPEPLPTPRPAADPAPAAPAVPTTSAATAFIAAAPAAALNAIKEGPSVLLPQRKAPAIASDITLALDQVLRFPIQSKRSTIAPWRTGSYIESAWNQDVFMPLFRFSPTGELLQGVAIGYDVNVDSTMFTIHIDPDAIFHDGSPVTAADVKAAWEFGGLPANQVSWGASLLTLTQVQGFDAVSDGDAEQASGLRAIDQRTLEISLNAPDPTWPLKLAVWMLGIFKADQAEADPAWEHHPIGVGPFRATFDPESSDIDLTPAANWWRDRPTLEKVELRFVGNLSTQLTMYERGEADLIFSDVARQPSVHDRRYIFNNDLVPIPDLSTWYFAFKTDSPPFDDPKVRAALAHAIDMPAAVMEGFGPTTPRATGMINTLLPCTDGSYVGYDYNPEKARQLLAESSYADTSLLAILEELGNPQFMSVAEIIQDNWRDILGIQVTIIPVESGQQRSDDANLFRRSVGSQIPDPGQLIYMLGHSASKEVQGTTGHSNPDLDAAIEEGNALPLDAPNRCSLYQNAQQQIIDGYYYLPVIFEGGRAYLVQPWVLGMQTAINDAWQSLPYIKIAQRRLGRP